MPIKYRLFANFAVRLNVESLINSMTMGKAGKVLKASASFMKALEANHPKGIRLRSRIAVICALAFIVLDVIFVADSYEYLPDIVSLKDSDGLFVRAVEKTAYIGYDIQRLIMLITAFFVAWAIKPCFRTPIIYKRVRCFILDIVNLTITSAIALTMVELAIALGDPQEVSYLSQWLSFLFWVAVMAVELAYDLRKIKPRK